LILVDNGRSIVQYSDLQEILYCIRCGSCLNACPVFREIGGHAYVSIDGKGSPYPGPIGSVLSPALFGQLEYGHLARASSLCGACREACPVDIDLPKLLLRIRAGNQVEKTSTKKRPNAPALLAIGLKLYTITASSPIFFATAQWFAGVFGSLVKIFSGGDPWMRLPGLTGWGYSKDFPTPPVKSFRSRFKKHSQAVEKEKIQDRPNRDMPILSPMGDETIVTPEHKGTDDFASEVRALGGNFTLCSSGDSVKIILDILRSKQIDQLLTWEVPNVTEQLLEGLSAEGIQILHPSADTLKASSVVPAGLTGASAGIADSGSLLLLGGAGRPMTASLLPRIHIAMLRESDIFENLGEVLERIDIMQAPAAIVVTGPSRTADIEMTLTIGVHGPGELYIICVRDE
jgi:L-lactate utilization protein LutB